MKSGMLYIITELIPLLVDNKALKVPSTETFTWFIRCIYYLKNTFIKTCKYMYYFWLFVRGFISCLCYLCLLVCGGIQHILCCAFVLFFFVLCDQCDQFLWIVHFWFPFRYSLTILHYTHTKIHLPQVQPILAISFRPSVIKRRYLFSAHD